MNKALLLIIIFIILIVFNFRLFSNTDNFQASATTPTILTQSIYEPLVLTDGDKKKVENIVDNNTNVKTLNDTQDNKSRLNKVLNMAEELSEKVPILIDRFKQNLKEEKPVENRIKETDN